jgi:tight adherence protein C
VLPFLDVIIEGLTFCIVVAIAFAAMGEIERVIAQKRRLGEQVFAPNLRASNLVKQQAVENPFFKWVQRSTSISDARENSILRRELALAGFDSPAAPVWFIIARFSIAIGLPALFLLVEAILPKPFGKAGLIFCSAMLCAVGLLLPRIFLDRRVAAKRSQMEFEFPDALDLMVVCVEAGLSLDATFVRVGQEVRESHPRIAQEFIRVSEELGAGRTRAEALRAMADRNSVPGITSFVTLVIQTEILGASIAVTLRTYSTEMRQTRLLKAEEKALRIPVLMTIPLVACMLPVIVTAIVLPAIIDVMRTLFPLMSGH